MLDSPAILIAYATKAGSTAGVAKTIANEFNKQGAFVRIANVLDIDSIEGFDAVVLGSAIRVGNWLPAAKKFIDTYQDQLLTKPVAIFEVCMTMIEDTEENREEAISYMDEIRNKIDPVDYKAFAGVIDLDRLSLIPRLMVRFIRAPRGDFRDWQDIKTWANDIYPKLVPVPTREPILDLEPEKELVF